MKLLFATYLSSVTKSALGIVLAVGGGLTAGQAQALQIWNFSYTYNGTTAILDPSSDVPTSSPLSPADQANITIRAQNDYYWTVLPTFQQQTFYATLAATTNATRNYSYNIGTYLNGSVVRSGSSSGVQQFAHFGAQQSPPDDIFYSGDTFDELRLNYVLNSDEGMGTLSGSDSLYFNPFYNNSLSFQYTYLNSSTSVPGPLPVLGAFAAFGFSRKLRKRIESSTNTVSSNYPF
jgi:hypothetical protein